MMYSEPKHTHTLTFHPHCCGRRPGRGLTCQRSPFYPVCWHRAAWLQCPERNRVQSVFQRRCSSSKHLCILFVQLLTTPLCLSTRILSHSKGTACWNVCKSLLHSLHFDLTSTYFYHLLGCSSTLGSHFIHVAFYDQ